MDYGGLSWIKIDYGPIMDCRGLMGLIMDYYTIVDYCVLLWYIADYHGFLNMHHQGIAWITRYAPQDSDHT